MRMKTRMIEYSTVYGAFFVGEQPVTGTAFFTPRRRFVSIDNTVLNLTTLGFPINDGILLSNGTPGVSIPASLAGIEWEVRVLPVGYSNMIQSYPGDTISLGD